MSHPCVVPRIKETDHDVCDNAANPERAAFEERNADVTGRTVVVQQLQKTYDGLRSLCVFETVVFQINLITHNIYIYTRVYTYTHTHTYVCVCATYV